MKKLILLICLEAFAQRSIAQPVLTSTDLNPLVGDVFYHHDCSTTGVSKGAAGAAITWDFSALSQTTADTLSYISCTPTSYCDSFPGATIVYADPYYYNYSSTNTTGFAYLGQESTGERTFYTKTYYFLHYPLSYNSVRVDTSVAITNSIPYDSFNFQKNTYIDSFICDGYGTVILPSGTYNNVLRLHQIDYHYDSTYNTSHTTAYQGRAEYYYWYIAGLHEMLVGMGYPTDSTSTSSPDYVLYTSQMSSGITNVNHVSTDLTVYPDPASEVINIRFNTSAAISTSIIITTLTGKTVGTIGADKIHNGTNDLSYPVAGLPAGMYLLQLISSEGNTVRKIIISR